MSEGEVVGIVANGALPHSFDAITRDAVPVGDYLVARTADGREVLGMVESTSIESEVMGIVRTFSDALRAGELAMANPYDKSYTCRVRVLGLLEGLRSGEVIMPSLPPVPGSAVRRATPGELSEVFGGSGRSWVPIGSLLRSREVRVHVDINKVASRHLAILASTGAGKSNLLALLAKAIANLRGTMVIFDYHGEYGGLDLNGRENHVEPTINPEDLDPDELADLLDIGEGASRQRYVLAHALDRARGSRDFWDGLLSGVEQVGRDEREYREAAERVADIIRLALRRYRTVLSPGAVPPVRRLAEGRVNIVNLSGLSPAQADVVISRYMEDVLVERKRCVGDSRGGCSLGRPVVLALEEAHVFVAQNRRTRTKDVASMIAREGRKFGVSLVIVSQRPQRLDQDVLSQMGSLAVGRLINQRDRSFVQESSEYLTEEMAEYLPDLNPGEAILLGQWVKLPTLVKVDRVEEKRAGRDIDAVDEWSRGSELGPSEDTEEFIRR